MKFYYDDLKDDLRPCEWSEKVVKCWFDGRIVYRPEPDVENLDYLNIVAERIVVRRLLGLEYLERQQVAQVLNAKPFGGDGPLCAELLLPDVFSAMAFVPLTPRVNTGKPILARLYCVDGLSRRYSLINLLSGGQLPEMGAYSWFLTGVPDERLGREIDGRSWLLAAELLRRVVEKRDLATARNLARNFIVTGDVCNGQICRVEMGRKGELMQRCVYKDFKWIIPKENEMNNVPKRKVEKPATLGEAYALIESMQSVATKSMFRFIRMGDLAGVKEQYRNHADIYAREECSGLTPLQVVAKEFDAEVKEMKDGTKSSDDSQKNDRHLQRVRAMSGIRKWLKQVGADCSMMYYMLAKIGNVDAIKKCAETYPLNAVDDLGLTAVDWALNAEEWDVAALLHSCGASCNPVIGQNAKLGRAMGWLCDRNSDIYEFLSKRDYDKDMELIAHAIRFGLSYDTKVVMQGRFDGDDDLHCSLFAAAVKCLSYDVMKACLDCGADANAELEYDISLLHGGEEEYLRPSECGTPMKIVQSKNGWTQEHKEKIIKLLRDYGAKEV